MNKFLQIEKQHLVEGDFFAFLKNISSLLKLMTSETGFLVGGIGGLIIGSIMILAILFTLYAVCAFVNYGICYLF